MYATASCASNRLRATVSPRYHSTSFQISGCMTPFSPTSAKRATARFRCVHRVGLAAGGAQDVGEVFVERRPAVSVALRGAKLERRLRQLLGALEVALVPGREREVVERRHPGAGSPRRSASARLSSRWARERLAQRDDPLGALRHGRSDARRPQAVPESRRVASTKK